MNKFSHNFHSHWIKVKFYKEMPNPKDYRRVSGVHFCEATKQAILSPIILDKESISCPGAQYVFGWKPDFGNEFLDTCQEKIKTSKKKIKSLLSGISCLKEPFNYIGLNTEGKPDLFISYVQPEEVMYLIKVYQRHTGKNLDITLCNMMPICGYVTVRTYLTEKIGLSFGCDNSRGLADVGRDRLAIGIPNRLAKLFID
ncbi:hypothetical protein ES705_19983 [subsurface metagenome]